MSHGQHFLQIPGPSPVPERVLRAIDRQVIDHRGPDFQKLGQEVLAAIKPVFGTTQPVIIFPSSGTGAWEAAIVNTLSSVDFLPGDWRHGVDAAAIEAKLAEDKGHIIKAVMVVHNETSTGCLSDIAAVRKAIDATRHPALLMVDTISSLGSAPVRHDAWGVDVTVSGSQKGLMLPPGLSFTAVSDKALAASKTNTLPRSYWDWQEMISFNAKGFFPYTPATNLLYGLKEALAMLQEEGLDHVFARHQRLAAACRAAVRGWGLEILCADPAVYSPILTGVMMPAGHDADAFRKVALENFNISFGAGLGKVAGKVFRIGHLGDCNELTLMAAVCATEMSLKLANVPHKAGGVAAAMASFTEEGNALRLSA
jgi:alanine-glyoxylate transaminase/serine-glyoxylate transaminase/serine-pyruvate transaminase